SRLWPLALSGMIMHIIGLLDDIKAQSPRLKLAIQIVAAIMVVASGYRFRGFGFRQDAMEGQLAWLSVILSLGWVVGVTNAVNFIDGIDGLAGSVSFIVAMVYGTLYYHFGDASSSLICLCIAGVIVGFLLFNFPMPKAKIFMGDSGSLFLGFSLAVMPFLGQVPGMESSKVSLGLIPSITMLALPVFDALRVMGLRIAEGKNPMSPDRQHVHHLFLDSGYSTLRTDLILSLVTAGLAFVVLVAADMPQSLGFMLEFIAIGLLLIFFRYARYRASCEY
ncbi:MAG TPA: MraY family glycosyltransferase, partial [Rectinema sp.]|nr:MraY family glycosyltransferase [Rectinema sp.]